MCKSKKELVRGALNDSLHFYALSMQLELNVCEIFQQNITATCFCALLKCCNFKEVIFLINGTDLSRFSCFFFLSNLHVGQISDIGR